MKIISKYKLPIIIVLATIAIIALWLFNRNKLTKDIEPTPTPSPNTWQGITPGESSLEDLNNSLGEPVVASGEVYEYKSQNPNTNNQAIVVNNKVQLLKRIIVLEENLSLDETFLKYGFDYQTLYGPRSSIGDDLHVYINKGVALLGNKIDDSLSEIWYFAPVESVNDFITMYAQKYSTTRESTDILY